jgi:transcriptional regulator with XRE-family HTH domain
MQLHQKLNLLRKEHAYTLKQVAERTDKSIAYLADLEHGRALPSLYTLSELATLYRLTLSEILQDVEI